jgi:hypothetical protein
MMYRVPKRILFETFEHFRRCGHGRRECQVLWISEWSAIEDINSLVHPRHDGHFGGFTIDGAWLNSLWLELAKSKSGIRVQVHTHPDEAFHSTIDDDFPTIHTPGFLSLVIPRFGLGEIGFDDSYLTEIGPDGGWQQVRIRDRLEVT